MSIAEIQALRHQVQVLDTVGCHQPEAVRTRIATLAQGVTRGCDGHDESRPQPVSMTMAPRLVATDPGDVVTLDKAGYFVIVPLADRGVIPGEHDAASQENLPVEKQRQTHQENRRLPLGCAAVGLHGSFSRSTQR